MNDSPDKGREPLATALTRQDGDGAQVVAQGRGATAAQMTQVAGEHNIPVLQDFALSQALQRMPVGTQIPEPLFRALSGVLDFVFRQEAELAKIDDEEE
jgi:flagellar biosynthesis protein